MAEAPHSRSSLFDFDFDMLPDPVSHGAEKSADGNFMHLWLRHSMYGRTQRNVKKSAFGRQRMPSGRRSIQGKRGSKFEQDPPIHYIIYCHAVIAWCMLCWCSSGSFSRSRISALRLICQNEYTNSTGVCKTQVILTFKLVCYRAYEDSTMGFEIAATILNYCLFTLTRYSIHV